jgi:iron-sulfur cluster insertion protein
MKDLILKIQMNVTVAVAVKVLGYNMQIEVTDACVEKIKDLLIDEGNPHLMLRVFVQGGGCSGFQYGFTFDETQNEDDFEVNRDGVIFLIDSMSYQYLQGATIDYKEDLMSNEFVIRNPNAQSTCGCGSSFSV